MRGEANGGVGGGGSGNGSSSSSSSRGKRGSACRLPATPLRRGEQRERSLGPRRAWADTRRRRQGMGDGGRRRAVAQTPCTRGPAARRRRLLPSTLAAPSSAGEVPDDDAALPPFLVAAPRSQGRSRSLMDMSGKGVWRTRGWKRSFVGPFQGRRISWRLERVKAKAETFGVGLSQCCRAGTFFPILKRMAGSRGGGGGDVRYSVEYS